MGLLTREEHRTLTNLLLALPNLDDPRTRGLLVDALPTTVRQHMSLGGSNIIFANSLVNDVDADWARSDDGSWPILSLIEAAISLVPGRQMASDLQSLLDKIQARIEPSSPLPPPPASPWVARLPPRVTPVSAQADIKLTGSQSRDLTDALLSAFYSHEELKMMVYFELNEHLDAIASGRNLRELVFNLIQWAQAHGRLIELIEGARKENPGNPELRAFAGQLDLVPKITQPPGSMNSVSVEIERIVNKSAHFADVAAWQARLDEIVLRVCRIEYPPTEAQGTGFLVGPSVIMTNYHVVSDIITGAQSSNQVVLAFDYKTYARGLAIGHGTEYHLADDWLISHSPVEDLDYALLKVADQPGRERIGGMPDSPERGWLVPKSLSLDTGSPLFVIQHPQGQPLKVAFDVITEVTDTRVRYRTNTAHGSSGAPGFNDEWELVILHHGADPSKADAKYNEGIPFKTILEQDKVRAALGT